jgi:hypothetical protein
MDNIELERWKESIELNRWAHEQWAQERVQVEFTRREIELVCGAIVGCIEDYENEDRYADKIGYLIPRLREAQCSPSVYAMEEEDDTEEEGP